jgi:hypothetical protein
MTILRDGILIVGVFCIVTGLYQAWPPLAWIVGGLFFCGGAIGWLIVERRAFDKKE